MNKLLRAEKKNRGLMNIRRGRRGQDETAKDALEMDKEKEKEKEKEEKEKKAGEVKQRMSLSLLMNPVSPEKIKEEENDDDDDDDDYGNDQLDWIEIIIQPPPTRRPPPSATPTPAPTPAPAPPLSSNTNNYKNNNMEERKKQNKRGCLATTPEQKRVCMKKINEHIDFLLKGRNPPPEGVSEEEWEQTKRLRMVVNQWKEWFYGMGLSRRYAPAGWVEYEGEGADWEE
ncbi:hypothetical protein QBC44DRAFT_378881 [Cladorrhinum sp. PSN332]|nr:hypothetical protein QBC44DRAFT_378881 [Cladorrhinum sp. PSN332]